MAPLAAALLDILERARLEARCAVSVERGAKEEHSAPYLTHVETLHDVIRNTWSMCIKA